MNHKSIIRLFSILFGFGIFDSILQFHSNSNVAPEIIFSFFFVSMIIVCICFFKREDLMMKKHQDYKFIQFFNQDLFIGKNTKAKRSKRNLMEPYNFTSAHSIAKIK